MDWESYNDFENWEDQPYDIEEEDFFDEEDIFDAEWAEEYSDEWGNKDFREQRHGGRRERNHEGRRDHKREGRHGRHLSSRIGNSRHNIVGGPNAETKDKLSGRKLSEQHVVFFMQTAQAQAYYPQKKQAYDMTVFGH